jgi:hypothetical protein
MHNSIKTCPRRHQLLLISLASVPVACDFNPPPAGHGPVIKKNGQTFQVSLNNSPPSNSNHVRVASRAQVAGGQLRQTEWWIDRQVLEKQPRWNSLTDELPFSAQRACGLALPDVERRFPEVQEWRVQTVYLRNLSSGGTTGNMYSYPNVWIYEITFAPANEMNKKKLEDDVGVAALTQVVLLDGTIVAPTTIK